MQQRSQTRLEICSGRSKNYRWQFGMEHRLRKEEMDEQFNKEAKQGWRLAADAARITDGNAVRIANTRREVVATDSNLGAVVGTEEGAVASIPGNEGRIAHAWVNVRGGMRVFSVYFWHSEGSREMRLCWRQ